MIRTEPHPGSETRYGNRFLNSQWVLIPLILLFVILAWSSRFMTDDAFISFRYASNFVAGDGLVWNQGERVEGYTNFLWTILIALAISAGMDPVAASVILGISSFCVTLIATYKLSFLVLRSRTQAVLSIVLLGLNYTFIAYATGGIETQLQAALFVVAALFLLKLRNLPQVRIADALRLSIISTAAIFLRLDSIVVIGPLLLIGVIDIWNGTGEASLRTRASRVACLIAPATVMIAAWLLWKLHFYGDILPNTFYAKVAGNQLAPGAAYLYKFLISYWLIPFPLFVAGFLIMDRDARSYTVFLLFLFCALWILYVVGVGGDFMEFRFFVPVLPFFFVLITWVVASAVKQQAVRFTLFAIVLSGDLHHAMTYSFLWNRYPFGYVEPIRRMHNWVYADNGTGWADIGRLLGEVFRNHRNVVIAVTAAGAIPFYSRLPAVDMHGLSDQWIAKHGHQWGEKVGHQKIAPLSYLQQRNVNLVIGHPLIVNRGARYGFEYTMSDIHRWVLRIPSGQDVPAAAQLLEIPVGRDEKMIALYLRQSSAVDSVVAARQWKVVSMQ